MAAPAILPGERLTGELEELRMSGGAGPQSRSADEPNHTDLKRAARRYRRYGFASCSLLWNVTGILAQFTESLRTSDRSTEDRKNHQESSDSQITRTSANSLGLILREVVGLPGTPIS